MFHVSMLRKYTLDPAQVVDWGEIIVDTNGTFVGQPSDIIYSKNHVMHSHLILYGVPVHMKCGMSFHE